MKKFGAGSSLREVLLPMGLSVILGLCVFFGVVSLFAFLAADHGLDLSAARYMLLAASVFSALAAGFFMARRMNARGLISGVVAALPLLLFEIIFIIAFSGGFVSGAVYAFIPVMIFAGAVGGIFAANFKIRRKRN